MDLLFFFYFQTPLKNLIFVCTTCTVPIVQSTQVPPIKIVLMASSKADLVPITRDFLRKWCSTLSPPPVPEELNAVIAQMDEALASVSDSAPGSTIHKQLYREAPKKIDENLFRCREQAELIFEILDKPKNAAWKGLTAEMRKNLEAVFARVEEFQKNNNDRVKKLIVDFMPNDFRASMLQYQNDRSEKQKAAELQKMKERGAPISEKYNTLWAQQLARREKLVALGTASGMWKAVIKLLAGVPSVLLDFVKTINDDQGPVEEIRLTCAPNLYCIRNCLNKIHVLIAIGIETANETNIPLLTKASAILDSFSVVYLEFLTHVFTNAPWFVTASQLAATLGGGGGESDYIKISVDAGSKHTVPITVPANSTIAWDFKLESRDIAFSVTGPGGEVLVASTRIQSSPNPTKDTITAAKEGVYTLVWDNSYSYMTGKTLMYRTAIIDNAQDDAGAAAASE